MRRVFIIHCWEGFPEYCWYPWLKHELETRGVQVVVPAMPETKHPKMGAWVEKIAELVGQPDDQTVLVGHSIGCAAILRYLESLSEETKICGIVAVAGFTENVGFEEIQTFFETPFDFEKMRRICPSFVAIHSDDDPYVDVRFYTEFREKLGAKSIVKTGKKHFSGAIEGEEACLDIPEVLDEVVDMLKL